MKSEEKMETKSEEKSKENLLPESFLKPESWLGLLPQLQ